MKSYLKKTAVSMLVMGMAGTSFAAMSNNTAMWSPHMTGWFIGVDALDLRPMNGDLDFVTLRPNNSSGSFYNQAISTDFDWSWRLYAGIRFTDNDDLTFSWLRMRATDKDSVSPQGTFNGYGYSYPKWFYGDYWENVSAKLETHLDDVYGVWGHTINFNNPWSVRFAAGLEYVKLHSDLSVSATNFGNGYGTTSFYSDSHLSGFGPRAEFDATYHLPYNFALFANTNAALLVSDRKISLTPYYDHEYYEGYSSYFSTRHVVVPKFGMRLGASYTFMWGQAGGEGGPVSSLMLDAGWQVDSYIHAIERPDYAYGAAVSPIATSTDISGSYSTTKTSNFSDHGLFLGIKYSSDWM